MWDSAGQSSASAPYFARMWQLGIDAGRELLSPRQRDLVNLLFVTRCQNHEVPMHAVLDTTQFPSWCQWRVDGSLPTVSTGSRLYSMYHGRFLSSEEIYHQMGLLRRSDFS